MSKLLIGIDPDVTKSGFAFRNGNTVELKTLTFFELFETLRFYKEREVKPTVYVECGFLNGGNRHLNIGKSQALNSKIGERIGANHETAKKIIEMCEYLQLPYQKIQPKRSKIKTDEFKKLTGYTGRTNQEERDAFMLIFGR